MKKRVDHTGKFTSGFDERTGFYYRSGVIEKGCDTGVDPFMSEFPELIDVGIMGHCIHGMSGRCMLAKVQCYQNGPNIQQPNMRLDDFRSIVKQCKGKTYQFALGGRGDPDQHENFKEILKLCRDNGIVPNFTSSGFGFNEQIAGVCSEYCGAVAVSWYRSPYTLRAVELLLRAKVKTNIHYVLSNDTIDEAVSRLKKDDFPRGINAVIFLLHKPVGLGRESNVLSSEDKRVKKFFELVECRRHFYKIGFDSCTVPGLLRYSKMTDSISIDTCEGGRWSAYITPDMKMLPCSFDSEEMRWCVDLRTHTIKEAWNSQVFEAFRNILRSACPECGIREHCMGGCPIRKEIVLCGDREEFSAEDL